MTFSSRPDPYIRNNRRLRAHSRLYNLDRREKMQLSLVPAEGRISVGYAAEPSVASHVGNIHGLGTTQGTEKYDD
jgi:hypothetical protein